MRILVAISVLAFVTLLISCVAIALYVRRARRRQSPSTPVEPPRNLANPL